MPLWTSPCSSPPVKVRTMLRARNAVANPIVRNLKAIKALLLLARAPGIEPPPWNDYWPIPHRPRLGGGLDNGTRSSAPLTA